ncbi:hypothetical protein DFJ74DRAFT_239444 [Hyaloraphidium curvatum]|nr:hypothetical protein DFJ74DRAFT_239444 [Hyaloraphidium curvatum]
MTDTPRLPAAAPPATPADADTTDSEAAEPERPATPVLASASLQTTPASSPARRSHDDRPAGSSGVCKRLLRANGENGQDDHQDKRTRLDEANEGARDTFQDVPDLLSALEGDDDAALSKLDAEAAWILQTLPDEPFLPDPPPHGHLKMQGWLERLFEEDSSTFVSTGYADEPEDGGYGSDTETSTAGDCSGDEDDAGLFDLEFENCYEDEDVFYGLQRHGRSGLFPSRESNE